MGNRRLPTKKHQPAPLHAPGSGSRDGELLRLNANRDQYDLFTYRVEKVLTASASIQSNYYILARLGF